MERLHIQAGERPEGSQWKDMTDVGDQLAARLHEMEMAVAIASGAGTTDELAHFEIDPDDGDPVDAIHEWADSFALDVEVSRAFGLDGQDRGIRLVRMVLTTGGPHVELTGRYAPHAEVSLSVFWSGEWSARTQTYAACTVFERFCAAFYGIEA